MLKFNENPGNELFHAEERTYGPTDMMKLIVAFRKFANAPKNMAHYSKIITDNKARKNNNLRPTVHF
jgi:hypothetical protein